MRRLLMTWCTFAFCLAIVFGAMAWFTIEVRYMQRRAVIEENARLALWRMDSKLAALLAKENSLPVAGFDQLPHEGAIAGRFRVQQNGNVVGDVPPVAVAQLPDIKPAPPPRVAQIPQQQEQTKTQNDYQQRSQQMFMNANAYLPSPTDYERGAFKPHFVNNHLILLRTVTGGDDCTADGVTIDWQALQNELLTDVRDLLPHATLQTDGEATPYRLTVIPASLTPGALPAADVPPATPLLIAWCAVLAAAIAAGVLLHLTLRLSQRRAAFVSAVTHEMRTPLTTLRLYTEMLRDNRVRDDATRQQYLATLTTEADRLSHLVDNVLAHARLERGKSPEALQTMTLANLLARSESRLHNRCAQANMTLRIEGDRETTVRAEPTIVEQILLNLIDNACKYSGGGEVAITLHDNTITVTDAGPGVAGDVRKRLFTPFAKSAHDAANSAPGVGLGLALSRRLARAMGGDLRYDRSYTQGARFTIALARAV